MDLIFIGRLIASCAVIGLVLAGVQFGVRNVVRARAHLGLRGGRLVNVLETTMLPGAASLHVIRVADRYLVVGRSGSQLARICDVPLESIEAWRNNGIPPSPGLLAAIGRP